MKRYTIRLHPSQSSSGVDGIRAALERELLHLPITFRLGAAKREESGEAILEIASDSGIDDLRDRLASMARGLASSAPSVEWGWQVSSGDGGPDPGDLFQETTPLADGDRLGSNTRSGVLRLLGSLMILPAILLLGIVRVYLTEHDLPFLLMLSVLGFMFALTAARNPWSLVRSMECGRDALLLRFWVRGRRTIPWGTITGLDVHPEQLVFRLRARRLVVATAGIPHYDRVAVTVRERSRLWFVQAIPPAGAIYRRADSP